MIESSTGFEYKAITTTVSIFRKGSNFLYGKENTIVELADEGGGAYIVLKQFDEAIEPNEIRLEIEELELVMQIAKEMISQKSLEDSGK